MGFGADGQFRYDGGAGLPDGDLKIEAKIEVTEWLNPERTSKFAVASTSDIETSFSAWPGSDELVVDGGYEEVIRNFVAFKVDSKYCDPMKAAISTVFRDTDGEVIGGTHGGYPILADFESGTGKVSIPDDYKGTTDGMKAAMFTPRKSDPAMVFPARDAMNANMYSIISDADKKATTVYVSTPQG